jgi:amino acid adenylation domain-containing protein
MPYLLWHYVTDTARSHPSRLAIDAGGRSLTYAELDELSDRVALALFTAGVGRDCRVGLFLPKSVDSIVAMVGSLKGGAAYVPIDPSAPAARAAYILRDCQVSALVTTSGKLSQLGESLGELTSLRLVLLADEADAPIVRMPVMRLEELEPADATDRLWPSATEIDPAYLLYTSGSTGDPKGVILSHRNAMSFVEWAAECVGVRPEDRLSNHAPLHFDLSVFDIYAAFQAGASLVLVPDRIAPFPVALTKWIRDERISVWYSVPSALIRLLLRGGLAETELYDLRTVIFAGEVFPVKYLRDVMDCLPRAEFLNWYGPTETNVCTYYRVPRPLDQNIKSIPIGGPCENTDAVPVDADDLPVGPGEEGELLVRGPTVMLGYWGLSKKTGEQLVENLRQSAYRDVWYRTGDVVRREETGDYTFVGRRDHMVKSRGYRIELGEIETVLYQHDSISEAAVVAIPDDEIGVRLAAVLVSSEDKTIEDGEIRAFCAARLPRYMIPEAYVFRAALPRTSTGKTDRTALVSELTRQAAGPH